MNSHVFVATPGRQGHGGGGDAGCYGHLFRGRASSVAFGRFWVNVRSFISVAHGGIFRYERVVLCVVFIGDVVVDGSVYGLGVGQQVTKFRRFGIRGRSTYSTISIGG